MLFDDTIVAIATPPGRGGIGVVRIAGSEAVNIARQMLRLPRGLAANLAVFGELIEPGTGERIDEVVVTYFAAPHSYTTDDIVEISAHGSPVVLRRLVEVALGSGARLAEPGEFTMRAFLHGRLDLTQAEAVRDLIDSQTLYQAKIAAQQLDGALSKRLKPIKQELVQLIARLEAGVDFAEDDVSVMPAPAILAAMEKMQAPLQKLAHSFAFGRVVREGVTLAIVGRPNVGKSSLFNRLIERDRAIVTASPGTTRDLVTETTAMDGIPVRLVDTAGIREAKDDAERMGIEKSYEALADADVVLIVTEPGRSGPARLFDQELLDRAKGRPTLLVMNKCDLAASSPNEIAPPGIRTSALSGEGIPELRQSILQMVRGDDAAEQELGFLTNARQHSLVAASLKSLETARQAVADNIPHEMLLLDLYAALRPLDAITGETTTDDILNVIFGSFCIGK